MSQVKIYGIKDALNPIKARLSEIIHSCIVDALAFPKDKRVHRFFPMERDDFLYLASSTERYTIIEISMMEGRSVEAKKHLIKLLFSRIEAELSLLPHEIEITITESPKHNWGFRGQTGDEIQLNYKVEV